MRSADAPRSQSAVAWSGRADAAGAPSTSRASAVAHATNRRRLSIEPPPAALSGSGSGAAAVAGACHEAGGSVEPAGKRRLRVFGVGAFRFGLLGTSFGAALGDGGGPTVEREPVGLEPPVERPPQETNDGEATTSSNRRSYERLLALSPIWIFEMGEVPVLSDRERTGAPLTHNATEPVVPTTVRTSSSVHTPIGTVVELQRHLLVAFAR